MSDLLHVTGITAGYRDGPAILDGAHLTVEPCKVHWIIGPNGAGKSTMLKAICGMLKIREGDVVFSGRRLNGLRPDQILRENLRMGGFILNDRKELENASTASSNASRSSRSGRTSRPAPCPATSSRRLPWPAR